MSEVSGKCPSKSVNGPEVGKKEKELTTQGCVHMAVGLQMCKGAGMFMQVGIFQTSKIKETG